MKRSIPEKETLTVEFKSDQKMLSDEALIDAVVTLGHEE